jgi:hypothetical protein
MSSRKAAVLEDGDWRFEVDRRALAAHVLV